MLNRQFQEDPGRVYDVYNCTDTSEENKQMFENIDEASRYWKELWETEGTGDKSAIWLQEVKRAIHGCVPPPDEGEWGLTDDETVKIIGKKTT